MLQESVRLLKSDLQLEPGQKTFLEPSLYVIIIPIARHLF